MKKRFLFLALLLPFIFTGCDDINFGVQRVDNVCLILEGVDSLDITVTCESEKLNIYENTECKDITDEGTHDSFKEYAADMLCLQAAAHPELATTKGN